MAPGLKKLFKRQVDEAEEPEEGDEPTTMQTKIFGHHLHKVRLTTPTTTAETEGESVGGRPDDEGVRGMSWNCFVFLRELWIFRASEYS